jgi:hypothetical protein
MKISSLFFVLVSITFTIAIFWSSNHALSQIGKCDPAYPDSCISSPPPDLNCTDTSVNNFTELSELYGFDRNIDGIGCEFLIAIVYEK